MRKFLIACVIVAFAGAIVALTGTAQESKAKYTTKEVMQKAHKGGLMKKVSEGKATADETDAARSR